MSRHYTLVTPSEVAFVTSILSLFLLFPSLFVRVYLSGVFQKELSHTPTAHTHTHTQSWVATDGHHEVGGKEKDSKNKTQLSHTPRAHTPLARWASSSWTPWRWTPNLRPRRPATTPPSRRCPRSSLAGLPRRSRSTSPTSPGGASWRVTHPCRCACGRQGCGARSRA